MPVYTVSTRTPVLQAQRDVLARAITRVHCDLTGAPAIFVQVLYGHDLPLRPGVEAHLLANTRAGRTDEVNATLKRQMTEALVEHLDVAAEHISITLLEIPARWIMEGGDVLPEPGEEAQSRWGEQTVANEEETHVS